MLVDALAEQGLGGLAGGALGGQRRQPIADAGVQVVARLRHGAHLLHQRLQAARLLRHHLFQKKKNQQLATARLSLVVEKRNRKKEEDRGAFGQDDVAEDDGRVLKGGDQIAAAEVVEVVRVQRVPAGAPDRTDAGAGRVRPPPAVRRAVQAQLQVPAH